MRGEVLAGLDVALADAFARCQQLALGAAREGFGAHAREHLDRGAQLLAGVDPAALAAQPLAVEEMGARQINAEARALEALDRLPVEAVDGIAAAEQCARPGVDPQRPLGAAGPRPLGEQLMRAAGELVVAGPNGRF